MTEDTSLLWVTVQPVSFTLVQVKAFSVKVGGMKNLMSLLAE